MWILRWETQSGHHGAMWRSRAKDLGNGSYLASLPATLRGIHALAHVQLWWTASVRSEHFLLHDWVQHGGRGFENVTAGGAPRCIGEALPSSPLHLPPQTSGMRHPQGRPCEERSSMRGHWRFADGRYEWRPAGCGVGDNPCDNAFRCSWHDRVCLQAEAASCLAGRRLVLLGDSVLAGTFLDLCALLGHGNDTCVKIGPNVGWQTRPENISMLPRVPLAFMPVFSLPGRTGLANMVGDETMREAWERLLSSASSDTIVVLQSGLHDVGMMPPSKHRAAPLQRYEHDLRQLARLVGRVRRRNPSVVFVWRAMMEGVLMADTPTAALRDGCSVNDMPQTHPDVVDFMNQAAAKAFARTPGVTVWPEAAPLTFSAPTAAWRTFTGQRDVVHHDKCGRGVSAMREGSGRCHAPNAPADRSQSLYPGYKNWLQGGLSTTITQTLFAVLNCTCALP